MSTQPTCQERVDAEFHSRYDDLEKLWAGYCNEECPDCNGTGYFQTPGHFSIDCELCKGTGKLSEDVPDLGNIYEYGLSFDYVAPHTFHDQERGYFRYQLSWGGPSDEFRIYAEGREYSWHVDTIEYWFLDWFDGAKRVLTGAHFRFIAELFDNLFVETGTAEHEYNEAMQDYEEPDEEEEQEDTEDEED